MSKEYYTLPEAARRLAKLSDDEFNVADVLDSVLQGRLKLSVKIVKETPAKLYPLSSVDADELPKVEYVNFPGIGMVQKPRGNIIPIQGIYDLPMKGGEILDIQYEQEKYYVSSAVKYINTEGTYVEGSDGQVFQLQEYCKDEYSGCGIIPERIPIPKDEISGIPDLVRPVESSQEEQKEDSLEKGSTKVDNSNEPKEHEHNEKFYYDHYIMRPAGCLPKDSLLIVRKSALNELIRILSIEWEKENKSSKEEPLVGMKAIAEYLKCSVSLIKIYKRYQGMPFERRPGGRIISVKRSALEAWLQERESNGK